ncbi:MAG: hypothetical protein U5R46_00900 [Gammaproteobacteria bacterium]|nr:hypothetical protein [Gammaproteobacteria bacterium]
MRTITSDDGQLWDVAVQQASYGAHFLLFAARGSDETRHALMGASTHIAAERELAELSDEQLITRLSELPPSDPNQPPDPLA